MFTDYEKINFAPERWRGFSLLIQQPFTSNWGVVPLEIEARVKVEI